MVSYVWALKSNAHSESLFPFFCHFSLHTLFSFSFIFHSAHYMVHSLFLCSLPPISVKLKLCHSLYITQQSSRARLVTTTSQFLPDPLLILVQTTTELCGQKTSCGKWTKAESITSGNANFMTFYISSIFWPNLCSSLPLSCFTSVVANFVSTDQLSSNYGKNSIH